MARTDVRGAAVVTPARSNPSCAARLVEKDQAWTLTIALTDEVRAALLRGDGSATADAPATIEVRVRPNLVPGEPFPATIVFSAP